eukprot:Amastigsp_a668_28.p4 type:complete len:176 gc:universal Amastigsp_a668_28:1504-977(-)
MTKPSVRTPRDVTAEALMSSDGARSTRTNTTELLGENLSAFEMRFPRALASRSPSERTTRGSTISAPNPSASSTPMNRAVAENSATTRRTRASRSRSVRRTTGACAASASSLSGSCARMTLRISCIVSSNESEELRRIERVARTSARERSCSAGTTERDDAASCRGDTTLSASLE